MVSGARSRPRRGADPLPASRRQGHSWDVHRIADAEEIGPVGYAWLALEGPNASSAWIYDIAIDEEHRGKGYGRALLNGLEQVAREHGHESIGLNVSAGNDYARRLYERAGFQPTSIHMSKRLDDETD